MSTLTSIGPSEKGATYLSTTGNIQAAMLMIVQYMESTYKLQAADTVLEQAISSQEAQKVEQFNQELNQIGDPANPYNPNANIDNSGVGNWIWQLEHLTDSTQIGTISQLYTQANSQNQALVKVMDGNNSTAQNTLSQNSQGQQGVIQTLGAINGVAGNLTRLIQG